MPSSSKISTALSASNNSPDSSPAHHSNLTMHFGTKTAADAIYMSVPTVRKYLKLGHFPHAFTVPGTREIRIPATDLRDFCVRNKIPVPNYLTNCAALYERNYSHAGTLKDKSETASQP